MNTLDDHTKTPMPMARGINDQGKVVGFAFDPAGNEHGFVRDAEGYTFFDDPLASPGTAAFSINDAGTVNGLQLGLVNRTTHLHGVQLGLGNVVFDSVLGDCAGATGLEPATVGFGDRCSTN